MSYWGVIVIVKVVTVIPIVGYLVSQWLWCSSFVIINRVFIFHYLIGFIIGGLIILHIIILHSSASSNPWLNSSSFMVPFILILYKDLFCLNCLGLVMSCFYFMEPDILGNWLNFSECINYSIRHNSWMVFLFVLFYYKSYSN